MNTVQNPPSSQPGSKSRRELPRYSIREFVFALVFLLVALLFSFAMPFRETPLAVLLLSVALLLLTVLFYGKGVMAKKRRPIVILALYGVFLIPFLTNANATLRFFTFLLLLLLLAFFWYDKTVLTHEAMEDNRLLFHVWESLLCYFSSFTALFSVLFSTVSRGERAKKGWRAFGFAMLGLVGALLPTLIVGLLLSYDSSFTSLLNRIFDFSIDVDTLFERILDIIVSIPLGAAFFSLAWSSKRKKVKTAREIPTAVSVPRAALYAAVTPMLILYALFFFSQKDYYLSAFTKALPDGLTFAEYAREGFFQLCIVTLINAAVLIAFSLLARKKEGSREILCRIYQSVIAFFTLILIATALSKMALYIDAYGLTHKRVYASWLMLLLSVIFLLVLLKQWVVRLPLMKATIVTAILFFALIALPNTDAMIANYNVDRYLDGTLSDVDIDELEELGISSVEARIRLEKEWRAREEAHGATALSNEEKEKLAQLCATLDAEKENLDRSFFAFSIPNYRARVLLEERE